jgi:hypothetical protein
MSAKDRAKRLLLLLDKKEYFDQEDYDPLLVYQIAAQKLNLVDLPASPGQLNLSMGLNKLVEDGYVRIEYSEDYSLGHDLFDHWRIVLTDKGKKYVSDNKLGFFGSL